MIKTLYARMKQKFRTIPFPKKEPVLPKRFRGLPSLKCAPVCPTGAFDKNCIDLGKCLFCNKCAPFSNDFKMAVNSRKELIFSGQKLELAKALKTKLFNQSLKLRQVCAGGCNGCELDCNVLNTIVFDLGRFGIQFVASPRHADGLLITGPVTKNMEVALKKTYEAVALPKIVIAVGACAISGGPYIDHPEVLNGVDNFFPVDLYIPGCPPHPLTILDGLLRMIGIDTLR